MNGISRFSLKDIKKHLELINLLSFNINLSFCKRNIYLSNTEIKIS